MEFNNRLYQLRKQKGFSQEELASRLNVSRQTVSKWEIGDSTPDMEKLAAISDLFEVSLDELILGKQTQVTKREDAAPSVGQVLQEKVLTPKNGEIAKKVLKWVGIGFGVVMLIEVVSMIIVYFVYGFPAKAILTP